MEFSTIKGFKDILPQEVGNWHYLETVARNLFKLFGFKEIRPPLLERTELFSRSIGQDTDIVSKEMYTITDSKGRGMTLRPEATASVVRAYIQNRLYQDDPVQKLFTIGPMFRHERPQKGRFDSFIRSMPNSLVIAALVRMLISSIWPCICLQQWVWQGLY